MSYDPHQYDDPYAPPSYDQQWGGDAHGGKPADSYPHSGMGIASFIMAIAVGIGAFALVIAAGVIEASTPGGMDEESPIAIIIGLGIFGVMGLNLVGVGLGIGGLVQSERSKIFAYLGLAGNAMVILGICGLMCVGLAAGA